MALNRSHAAAVGLAATVIACATSREPTTPMAAADEVTIHGHVVDSAGNPVVGVIVHFDTNGGESIARATTGTAGARNSRCDGGSGIVRSRHFQRAVARPKASRGEILASADRATDFTTLTAQLARRTMTLDELPVETRRWR